MPVAYESLVKSHPILDAEIYSNMAFDKNLSRTELLLKIRTDLEVIYPGSYIYIAYNKDSNHPLVLLPGFIKPDNRENQYSDPQGSLKLSTGSKQSAFCYDYVAIREGTVLYTGNREDK
jgi:hypothetical protein